MKCSIIFAFDSRVHYSTACSTADVESTKRELSTGLTDGLGCDNTYNLSLFYHPAGGKITSIALGTNSLAAFASKHRTDFHLLDGERVNECGLIFTDFLACLQDEFSCDRVEDIVYRSTAKNPFPETFHYGVFVSDGSGYETAQSTAVVFSNDYIVRNVH